MARIIGVAGAARVGRALDVGCGTGLSAKALAEIADQVVAIDSVAQMLAHTSAGQRVEYLVGAAEHLPFEKATFDAATVSSSLHWFDHQAFFAEASRTLVDGGWLAIYDHYFLANILDDPAFAKWSTDQYLAEYPTPPRGPRFDPWEPHSGFVLLAADGYEDPIHFTHDELVCYLLTQSNCIAALQSGRTNLEDLNEWLTRETREFFPTPHGERQFQFYGTIAVLRTT